MPVHSLVKALVIALCCGAATFTATRVRQRQLAARDPARQPEGLTPLWAGLTATIGALLGIAIAQRWPA